MRPDLIDQVLRDYERLRDPDGDPELEAVKAAVLVEDVFGITLSDAEIGTAALGSAASVRRLLDSRGVV